MPQFLLLVSPERPAPEALSPAGMGRRAQDFITWLDALRHEERLAAGALLSPASERVSLDFAGPIPSALSNPGAPIRLYFLVEARDMRSALEIARDCPSALPGTIDVFEVEARVDIANPAAIAVRA